MEKRMTVNSQEILIRPYERKDLREVISLMVLAFKSKFTYITDMSTDDITDFLHESKIFDYHPYPGYYVAELHGSVAGVVSLLYKEQDRKTYKTKIKWGPLLKQYGYWNIIKLMFGLILLSESIRNRDCYIEHIAVSPNAQGIGVGRKLLEVCDSFVKTTESTDQLTLHVATNNKSAIRIYEKTGFKSLYQRKSLTTKFLFNQDEWLFMRKTFK